VPETKDFLNQLGPPRDPPSPAQPETKDFLNQLGPGPTHPAESETKDIIGLFLKGKIKRRISGSGAVNSAQETEANIGPRSYVFAFFPSPTNLQTTPGPWKIFDRSCDLRNYWRHRRGGVISKLCKNFLTFRVAQVNK